MIGAAGSSMCRGPACKLVPAARWSLLHFLQPQNLIKRYWAWLPSPSDLLNKIMLSPNPEIMVSGL